MTEFSELIGKRIGKIVHSVGGDESLVFHTLQEGGTPHHYGPGKKYKMQHHQDCCEHVFLAEIIGDLNDLLHTPIVYAEMRTNEGGPAPNEDEENDAMRWTFYELVTIKGSVTLRWFGSSNGYYSVDVDFEEITDDR